MSLTTFVEHPTIRGALNKHCPLKKELKPLSRPHMVAAPLTKNYAQVGVAFDYFIRFYLERLNLDFSKEFGWVAGGALRFVEVGSQQHKDFTEIINNAAIQKQNYLESGEITDELLSSILKLSTLEPIYRAKRGFEHVGRAETEDINDLKNLIETINESDWTCKNRCWLNPSFNASILVGGADADIVLDDMLIEIKTVKRFCVSRQHLNQLIGYYILDCIAGIDEITKPSSINKIGIYFSRYGYFWSARIEDLISPEMTEKMIFWWSKIRSKEWILLNLPDPTDPRTIKTERSPSPPLPLEQAASDSPER